MAKYLRLDPQKNRDELDETYRYYRKTLSTKPYPTLEGVEFTAQILQKNRPAPRRGAGLSTDGVGDEAVTAEKHRPLILRFMKAMVLANRWLFENKEAAIDFLTV